MRKFYSLLLVFIFFVSCKKSEKSDIIPLNDFTMLLFDVSMAQGAYQVNLFNLSDTLFIDSLSYLETIFERYNYTHNQFDSTLRYYSAHPIKLEKVYAHVLAELDKLKKQYDSQEEIRDTVNLWKNKKQFVMQGNTKYPTLETAVYDSGGLTFSAQYIAIDNTLEHTFKVRLDVLKFNGSKSYKVISKEAHSFTILDTLDIAIDLMLPYYSNFWVRASVYEPQVGIFKGDKVSGNIKVKDIMLEKRK